MSLARSSKPAGTPCIRVTSAGPCDSPAVEKPNLTALYHILSRSTYEQAAHAPANINQPPRSVIPTHTQGDGRSPPLLKRSPLPPWLPLKSGPPGSGWSIESLLPLASSPPLLPTLPPPALPPPALLSPALPLSTFPSPLLLSFDSMPFSSLNGSLLSKAE